MFSVTYRQRARPPLFIMFLLPLLLFERSNISIAQTLSLDDALSAAIQEAPVLRASAALTEAAQHATVPAGELPDPKLMVGLDNVPVEGDDRFSTGADFMTMQRIGLMQEFPNPAKRRARAEQANAQVDVMRADARIQRQTVLLETTLAWIERYTWEQREAQLALLKTENTLFDGAVRAQLAGAQGTALELLLPQEEAAEIAALQDQVRAGREQSLARLRRWIGSAAELPLSGDVPEWPISSAALRQQLNQHPDLLGFSSQERALDADIAAARADKHPDWDVAVAWLGRGSGFSDMAMLELRVDLPVFTGSRQTPMIASKRAQRLALDAEREASLREHIAMLEVEVLEYERLQQAERRYRDVLLPLADEKVALALAGWRSGNGALTTVLDARRERIDTRLKDISNTEALHQSAAQLHFAYADFNADGTGYTTGAEQ